MPNAKAGTNAPAFAFDQHESVDGPFTQWPIRTALYCYLRMYGRFAYAEPGRGSADGGVVFDDVVCQEHRTLPDLRSQSHHSKPSDTVEVYGAMRWDMPGNRIGAGDITQPPLVQGRMRHVQDIRCNCIVFQSTHPARGGTAKVHKKFFVSCA